MASSELPQVEVSVVLIERADMLLSEYNPKWETFTLPMGRRRRRYAAPAERESPLDAAVRTAARALGRPLPPSLVLQPIPLDAAPHVELRSGRDQFHKRYTYHVFGMRVNEAAVRHATGWHTIWLTREAFRTHRPISPSARWVIEHVPDDLFVK